MQHEPAGPRSFWKRYLAETFELDLRSMALARVILALVMLVDLALRAGDLTAHYTDAGVMPRDLLLASGGLSPYLSLHSWLSGSPTAVSCVFIAHALVLVLLLIGYRTRLASLLTWYLLLSLHKGNPTLLHAGDHTLRIVMFWCMFLPLGARFSVDSALNTLPRRRGDRYSSWWSCGLILQILLIYWFAGIFKLISPFWQDWSALYYIVNMDARLTAGGLWLRQFEGILPILSVLTIGFELLAPFLVLLPMTRGLGRIIAIVGFAGLHAAFGIVLDLGIFPYMSVAVWLLLVPESVWERLFRRLRTPLRTGLSIYYDGRCLFCERMVLIMRTFLLLPETSLRRAQEEPAVYEEMVRHNSWVVIDHRGRHRYRFEALVCVLRASVLAWPVAFVLSLRPFTAMGDRLYDLVAHHRPAASRLTGFLKRRPVHVEPSRLGNALASLLLAYVVVINVRSVDPRLRPIVPRPIVSAGRALGIDQRWRMFSTKLDVDGWYVIPGRLVNGREIDLFAGGRPVTWEKPQRVAATFPSDRWQNFLLSRGDITDPDRWRGYGRWLCEQFNAPREQDQRLESLTIYFMFERTERWRILPPAKWLLYEHSCGGSAHVNRGRAP